MKEIPIRFSLNGEAVEASVTATMTLLSLLRDVFGNTEVKEGCGRGDCGACAVLVDGVAANACLMLAVQIDGLSVVTVKGLLDEGRPHPLQKSFAEHGAVQCGFCTPGMIMNAYGLLLKNPNPTRQEIIEDMEGNLCRCGTYNRIIEAIETAAQEMR